MNAVSISRVFQPLLPSPFFDSEVKVLSHRDQTAQCLLVSCIFSVVCYGFLPLAFSPKSNKCALCIFCLQVTFLEDPVCKGSPHFVCLPIPNRLTPHISFISKGSHQASTAQHPRVILNMAQTGHLPTAAIVKIKTTARRGSRWLKRRFNGRRDSQASTDTRIISIVGPPFNRAPRLHLATASNRHCQGPPTNYRREEPTLGTDDDG